MTRALNYELTDEDAAKLTTYAKSILELKENSNVIYPVSIVPEVVNNNILFANFSWAWLSNVGGFEFKNPWLYFKDEADTSAAKYFAGQLDYFKSRWDAIL